MANARNLNRFVKNPLKTNNYQQWIVFFLVSLAAIEFFYVLEKYTVIESEKVFWWTIYYSLPISLLFTLAIRKYMLNILFADEPENEAKLNRTKKNFASIGLVLLMFNFCFYNTTILTNDWLGKDRYKLVMTEVLEVEDKRSGTSIFPGKGPQKWIVTLRIDGELHHITTRKKWMVGETFEMTLNTGGFWGILYVG